MFPGSLLEFRGSLQGKPNTVVPPSSSMCVHGQFQLKKKKLVIIVAHPHLCLTLKLNFIIGTHEQEAAVPCAQASDHLWVSDLSQGLGGDCCAQSRTPRLSDSITELRTGPQAAQPESPRGQPGGWESSLLTQLCSHITGGKELQEDAGSAARTTLEGLTEGMGER